MTVHSLDAPRWSAREIVPASEMFGGTFRTAVTIESILDRLRRQVGQHTAGIDVTSRVVYITYEEVAECPEPEPSPSA